MGKVKQLEIKNRTYYFYNDMINPKNFESNLLKIVKNITRALIFTILDTLQLKKLVICENIHSVNPLYLLINQASGYIEEKNGNKYLIFEDFGNENKELVKKYADV